MKKISLCGLFAALLIGLFLCTGDLFAQKSSGSAYLLEDDVLSITGGICTSPDYYLQFTLGQSSQIGESSGNMYFNDAGFWHTSQGFMSCTYHSADYDTPDWSIGLSELLRCIQFYSAGSHYCDAAGEDGYNPGTGDRSCPAHDSDYNPLDWSVGLSELLRSIQIYNVGCYECDETGEDGYTPGCSQTSSSAKTLASVEGLAASHGIENCDADNAIIEIQITYDGTLNAVGVSVELPIEASYVSAGGDDAPPIAPTPGATGVIEFAWITPPSSPIQFSYSLLVSDTAMAEGIRAQVLFRRAGGEIVAIVDPDLLKCGICTSDLDGDSDVDGSDFAAFAAAYSLGDSKADLDGNGNIDDADVGVFAEKFGDNRCEGNEL